MESSFFFENKHNSFKDKNILITGATGGIGKILTSHLIKLGANVIITSRSEKKVKEVFPSHRINYEIVNFEDPIKIKKIFINVMKKFEGKLDVLLLCHGIFHVGKLNETNMEEFDKSTNINVRSCFQFVSISSPFLKLSKGNIVVLSSVEAKIPFFDSFLNSLSKVSNTRKIIYILYILILYIHILYRTW